MKAKRRGHKRARSMPLDAGPEEIEMVRHREELDTENPKVILFGDNGGGAAALREDEDEA